MEHFAWLIPALPLIGFLFSILFGKRVPKSIVASVASVAILVPFLLTVAIFIPFASSPDSEAIRILLGEWIHIGKLSVNYSFQLDQLSLMMMLVITGVGFLIHVYSVGYMHDDPGFHRFFAYLNLFIFFMLILVMGSNYIMLFIGWEGVGLCSYLLIGFWYKNPEYNKSANKAFIMNRIGDLALLLGIFLLYLRFSTFEYNRISHEAMEIANDIASKSPMTVRLLKESISMVENLSPRDGYRLEQNQSKAMSKTADAQEAQQAFVQKRKPVFTGQ